jgi:hypothetical protein
MSRRMRSQVTRPVWLRRESSVVGGHIRYYGVPTNSHALHIFRFQVGRLWQRTRTKRQTGPAADVSCDEPLTEPSNRNCRDGSDHCGSDPPPRPVRRIPQQKGQTYVAHALNIIVSEGWLFARACGKAAVLRDQRFGPLRDQFWPFVDRLNAEFADHQPTDIVDRWNAGRYPELLSARFTTTTPRGRR